MKNLKKVLSLVLACATALTVMAGAAFTDQSDIKAAEAVSMLNQLGVIAGYTDGSYKPDETVTRAQMAKMIYVARTGSSDASAYANITTKFTDISGHWAAGYIKYCQSAGIIAGKSATTFDPDSTVTGQEAEKMLLIVMGYKAEKAGLTGSAWASNTQDLASENDLGDDVDADVAAALPRQYAAQLIYNTLNADWVKWSDDSDGYVVNDDEETVGEKYLGLYTDVGTVTSVSGDNLSISLNDDQQADSYHDSATTETFSSIDTDYSSLLGQEVKVMFKDKKTNSVLGVYSTDKNTVYTVNASAVEDDSAKVKFGGTSYSLEADGINTYYTDINGDEYSAVLDYNSANYEIDGETALSSDDGVFYDGYYQNGFADLDTCSDQITFIDSDDNGKLDTAIITEVLAGAVTYVSDSKVLVDGVSSKLDENIDPDDDNVADGITTDDWAAVSYNRFGENEDVVIADTASGSLTGTKEDQSNDIVDSFMKYKIDGTWYVGSVEAGEDLNTVKATCTVSYVLVGGVIYEIEKTSSSTSGASDLSDVAVVTAKSTSGIEDQVKIQFFDDTTKTVTIDGGKTDTYSSGDWSTVSSDGLFDYDGLEVGRAYEVSTSGDDYQFETLTTDDDYYGDYTALTDGSLTTATSSGSDAYVDRDGGYASGVKIDDTAAVIVYTVGTDSKVGDVDVITGKQFKNASSSDMDPVTGYSVALTSDVDGLTRVSALAVAVGDINTTGTSYDNYAYVTQDAYKSGSDIEYSIWTGSENITVTDEGNSYNEITQGMIIGYSSIDSDDVISDVEPLDVADDSTAGIIRTAVTAVSSDQDTITVDANIDGDGYVTADGTTELDISDATVMYVDSSEDTDAIGVESGSIKKASTGNDDYAPYKYTPNVLVYSLNGDASNDLVVFDVGGEIAGKSSDKMLAGGDTAYDAVLSTVASGAYAISGDGTVDLTATSTDYTGTITVSAPDYTTDGEASITIVATADSTTTSGTVTVSLTATNSDLSADSVTFSLAQLKAGKTYTISLTDATAAVVLTKSAA